jgi:hypothetical protein
MKLSSYLGSIVQDSEMNKIIDFQRPVWVDWLIDVYEQVASIFSSHNRTACM